MLVAGRERSFVEQRGCRGAMAEAVWLPAAAAWHRSRAGGAAALGQRHVHGVESTTTCTLATAFRVARSLGLRVEPVLPLFSAGWDLLRFTVAPRTRAVAWGMLPKILLIVGLRAIVADFAAQTVTLRLSVRLDHDHADPGAGAGG